MLRFITNSEAFLSHMLSHQLHEAISKLQPPVPRDQHSDRSSRRAVVEEVIAYEPNQYKVLSVRGGGGGSSDRTHPGTVPPSTAALKGPVKSATTPTASVGSVSHSNTEPNASGKNEAPDNYTSAGKIVVDNRGRVDNMFRNAHNGGNYVLVMDEQGTRWEQKQSPTPDQLQYRPDQEMAPSSLQPRRGSQDRYANAPEIAVLMGGGGVGGEDCVIELRRSADQRPYVQSQTLANVPTSDDAGVSNTSGGELHEMMDVPVFRTPYVDPKMYRNDMARDDRIAGTNDLFEGQYAGPRYLSRVKVHTASPAIVSDNPGDVEEKSDGKSGDVDTAQGDGKDGVLDAANQSPPSSDMMRLLELLITTQQQTLQVRK